MVERLIELSARRMWIVFGVVQDGPAADGPAGCICQAAANHTV